MCVGREAYLWARMEGCWLTHRCEHAPGSEKTSLPVQAACKIVARLSRGIRSRRNGFYRRPEDRVCLAPRATSAWPGPCSSPTKLMGGVWLFLLPARLPACLPTCERMSWNSGGGEGGRDVRNGKRNVLYCFACLQSCGNSTFVLPPHPPSAACCHRDLAGN